MVKSAGCFSIGLRFDSSPSSGLCRQALGIHMSHRHICRQNPKHIILFLKGKKEEGGRDREKGERKEEGTEGKRGGREERGKENQQTEDREREGGGERGKEEEEEIKRETDRVEDVPQ